MDTRNVIAAISLSAAVIILYSLYFAPPPITKEQLAEKNIGDVESDLAKEILFGGLSVGDPIIKTRHLIPFGGLTWEVDVFSGLNEGLMIAEVELESEDQDVILPPWVGEEITDDHRYANSSLSQIPLKDWHKHANPA